MFLLSFRQEQQICFFSSFLTNIHSFIVIFFSLIYSPDLLIPGTTDLRKSQLYYLFKQVTILSIGKT